MFESQDSPRTKDVFVDTTRWKRRQCDIHLDSCNKIYNQLQECKPNSDIYKDLLQFAELLKRERLIMIYERLKYSMPTVWFLHNNKFSDLTIFFSIDCPKITDKSVSFKICIEPREDMSTIYARGKMLIGNNVKKHYTFKNYDMVKTTLCNYLLDEMVKKKRKGSIKIRPRKNSVPDNLGSNKLKMTSH